MFPKQPPAHHLPNLHLQFTLEKYTFARNKNRSTQFPPYFASSSSIPTFPTTATPIPQAPPSPRTSIESVLPGARRTVGAPGAVVHGAVGPRVGAEAALLAMPEAAREALPGTWSTGRGTVMHVARRAKYWEVVEMERFL